MPQNFFIPVKESIFEGNVRPVVLYACYADEFITKAPRVMHSHSEQAELVLICSGSGAHHIDNHIYHTQVGDLVFYNSGTVHDETVVGEGKLETYSLGIGNLCLKGLPYNHFIPADVCPIVSCGRYFEDILALVRAIYRQSEQPGAVAAECAGYLVQALLVQVSLLIHERLRPIEPEAYSLGLRVKSYLDENYMEEISLEKIAQAVRANIYYLSHAFKDMSGYAPMQYVTRRRIGEAQNLLISTSRSITDIAMQVGYSNSNYFQNVFRSIVGMPPGQYRRKWQQVKGK